MGPSGGSSQRWLPGPRAAAVAVGHVSDQESYTDSTDGWSRKSAAGTLPPPIGRATHDATVGGGSPAQPQPAPSYRTGPGRPLTSEAILGPSKCQEDQGGQKVSLEEGQGATWLPARSVTGRTLAPVRPTSLARVASGSLMAPPWVHPGSGWGPERLSGGTGGGGGAVAPGGGEAPSPLPTLSCCGGCHEGRFWASACSFRMGSFPAAFPPPRRCC